jgi:hypothetical protein
MGRRIQTALTDDEDACGNRNSRITGITAFIAIQGGMG